jgi:hypothetical protein
LVGHATIMATLLLVAAGVGAGRERCAATRLGRALLRVPAGLAVALGAYLLSYSAIHHVIYRDGHPAWLAPEASADTIGPGGTLPPHSHLFSEEDDDAASSETDPTQKRPNASRAVEDAPKIREAVGITVTVRSAPPGGSCRLGYNPPQAASR